MIERREMTIRPACLFAVLVFLALTWVRENLAGESASERISRGEFEDMKRESRDSMDRARYMMLDSEGPKHLPIRVAYLDERTKALYLKAQELFRAGRYAEAREMFIRVSFRQPLLGECHGYLGQYYLEQEKDYSRAIDYLTRAIRNCRPDHRHVSLYYLALAYEGARRKAEALKTWEEYLKVYPKGSSRGTEAKKHIEALMAKPVPAPTGGKS